MNIWFFEKLFQWNNYNFHFRYLSVLFQLYILAPIILIPIKKFSNVALKYLIIFILSSSFIGIVLYLAINPLYIHEMNYWNVIKHPSKISSTLMADQYTGPWNYIFSFVIGITIAHMITGYKFKFGSKLNHIITFLAFTTTILALIWQKRFRFLDEKLDHVTERILHLLFWRTLYLSGFCWLIFSCASGKLSKYTRNFYGMIRGKTTRQNIW